MILRVLRWVGYLLLTVVLLIVATGIGVKLVPSSLFYVVEKATGHKIQAADFNLHYFPLGFEAEKLVVVDPSVEDGLQLVLRKGVFRVDWWRALRNQSPFWLLEAEQGRLYLPQQEVTETPVEPEEGSVETPLPLDIISFFNFRRIQIADFTFQQKVGDQLQQTWLNLDIKRSGDSQLSIDAGYKAGELALTAQGILHYQRANNRTQLLLSFEQLDLSPLLLAPAPEDETGGVGGESTAVVQTETGSKEALLAWDWLVTVGELDFTLQVGELLLAGNQLNNLDARFNFFPGELRIEQISADVRLALASSETADGAAAVPKQTKAEPLLINGVIKPLATETQGIDVELDLSLTAIANKGFESRLNGVINVNSTAGNELAINLQLQELGSFAGLLPEGAGLQRHLPLKLQTKAVTGENSYRLNELVLNVADSDLSGSLTLDKTEDIWSVVADLDSKLLHLPKPESSAQQQKAEGQKKETKKPEKLIPTEPLDWSWLSAVNADISLTADMLKIFDAEFSAFNISAQSGKGRLKVEPFKGGFGSGGFDGNLSLERRGKGVNVAFDYHANGIDLEAFGFTSKEQLQGGVTEVAITLGSNGASPHDLASKLQGDILITVQRATIMNDTFEIIGSDLLMETINKLNPFAESDPTTELECALVHFEVEEGVLKSPNQLVVETTNMEIVGDGDINLNDETIDIGISPTTKQGVGLNVGSLVQFLKVGGTLASPSPSVDAGGLLETGATIGAAVSTGGLSIVAEGLVQKALNAGNACERALLPPAEQVVEQPGQQSGQSVGQQASQETPEQPASE